MSETFRHRLLALSAVLLALVLLLLAQLVRWQIVSRAAFMSIVDTNRSQPEEIRPRSGRVLDRGGHVLVMDGFRYKVEAWPDFVGDLDATVDVLEQLLPLTRAELQEKLSSDAKYLVLADDLGARAAETLIDLNLREITVVPGAYRFYPEGPLAGHLLGFVNAEGRGFGLEEYHHSQLRGRPGLRFVGWDPLGVLRDVSPENGSDLYLTLDYLLQQQVEYELVQGVNKAEADGGSCIILDPKSGAVLASASVPGYDPNQFPQLASGNPKLFTDPVISKQYEPGSVVKILTMAAALDSGLVTPSSTLEDREAIEVGGRVVRNWDGKGHGLVSMVDVLALSLNVCTAQLSTYMGSQTFYRYMSDFGLGQMTGIDLGGEVAGRVKRPGDADWSESELGINSFGQGVAVTPLQLTAAVASIAQGGQLMRPHVASRYVREGMEERIEPVPVRSVISSETAQQLTHMLVQVVERQAPEALVPGYQVAGKTGTAQVPIPGGYHPQDTVVSFVGYLPADDPQIVILVKVDRPRTGSSGRDVAAPIFSRVARRACHLLDIRPQAAADLNSPKLASR